MAKMENHPGQLEREMNVTWLIIAKAGITIACSFSLCIMIAWDRGSHLRFSNGCNLIFMF
jgi:hypothetical protein